VLGGLWHGAGWTFLAWGALHGLYLTLNHAWRAFGLQRFGDSALTRLAAWLLTFLAVIVAWVFFRAPDLPTAFNVLAGMLGLHGVVLTQAVPLRQVALLCLLTGIALFCPNVRQIMEHEELVIGAIRDRAEVASAFPSIPLRWRPTAVWAAASFALFAVSLLEMTHVSQFLYFRF
jgi:alginate O-acetyltransferase complex protein AlgI